MQKQRRAHTGARHHTRHVAAVKRAHIAGSRARASIQRQKSAQELEQEAGQQNALAEVQEALEDAAKTNARNALHDMLARKRHSQ
jgi:hypothetical protein